MGTYMDRSQRIQGCYLNATQHLNRVTSEYVDTLSKVGCNVVGLPLCMNFAKGEIGFFFEV